MKRLIVLFLSIILPLNIVVAEAQPNPVMEVIFGILDSEESVDPCDEYEPGSAPSFECCFDPCVHALMKNSCFMGSDGAICVPPGSSIQQIAQLCSDLCGSGG